MFPSTLRYSPSARDVCLRQAGCDRGTSPSPMTRRAPSAGPWCAPWSPAAPILGRRRYAATIALPRRAERSPRAARAPPPAGRSERWTSQNDSPARSGRRQLDESGIAYVGAADAASGVATRLSAARSDKAQRRPHPQARRRIRRHVAESGEKSGDPLRASATLLLTQNRSVAPRTTN